MEILKDDIQSEVLILIQASSSPKKSKLVKPQSMFPYGQEVLVKNARNWPMEIILFSLTSGSFLIFNFAYWADVLT